MTLVKWQTWHRARKASILTLERFPVIEKPVKKKALKKKSKRRAEIKKVFDPASQAAAEREIKKGMATLDEIIDDRYEFAKKVVEAQSSHVQQAIDDLVGKMTDMAGEPVFYYKGVPVHVADKEVCARMQGKNFYWMAVRLLVACAKWDIQVADFKAPKDECAMCGKKP
jgi:hypothetical protein